MESEKLLKKIGEGRQYRATAELLRIKDGGSADSEMIVEGYASTFNEPYTLYDDGEFRIDEQIDPAAFEMCDMTDVIFQYNHEGRVYARSRNGTLEVSTDDKGLKIKANLGGTEAGRQLFQEIRDGYTDRMSFGFTVGEEKVERYENKENHTIRVLRTITRVRKLYDVSAVSIPANDGTSISARSYSDGLIAQLKAERQEKRAALEAARARARALLSI